MRAMTGSLRKTIYGGLLAACTLLPAVAYCAEEPVAMVTDVTGDVRVTKNQKESPCEIFSSLIPGAELHAGEGATVNVVYLGSAKEYAYTGAAHFVIKIDAPQLVSGKEPVARELSLAKETGIVPANDNFGQAAMVFRGTAKKPTIRLIRPLNSKVLDQKAVFEWEPLDKGVQYRFVLAGDDGRILLETLVDATNFILPTSVGLKPEVLYSWTVEARLASGAVYSSTADFSLASEKEGAEISKLRPADNASFSERLIYAALLEKRGLRDAAQMEWNKLSKERPGDRGLKRRANPD